MFALPVKKDGRILKAASIVFQPGEMNQFPKEFFANPFMVIGQSYRLMKIALFFYFIQGLIVEIVLKGKFCVHVLKDPGIEIILYTHAIRNQYRNLLFHPSISLNCF